MHLVKTVSEYPFPTFLGLAGHHYTEKDMSIDFMGVHDRIICLRAASQQSFWTSRICECHSDLASDKTSYQFVAKARSG